MLEILSKKIIRLRLKKIFQYTYINNKPKRIIHQNNENTPLYFIPIMQKVLALFPLLLLISFLHNMIFFNIIYFFKEFTIIIKIKTLNMIVSFVSAKLIE